MGLFRAILIIDFIRNILHFLLTYSIKEKETKINSFLAINLFIQNCKT